MGDKFVTNAIIESASLTRADHGVLSGWLTLNYGGTGQGFGGYSLYLPKSFKNHDLNVNYAGHFIFRVMEIAEVEKWEDLPGKTIRVRKSDEWGLIEAIGHIVKEDWFSPAEDFKPFEQRGGSR